MKINLFGGFAKPIALWITVPTPEGDRVACSVCGTCLEPVGSSDVMYPGDEADEIIHESVEIIKTPKYCPSCRMRMSNWRNLEFGD